MAWMSAVVISVTLIFLTIVILCVLRSKGISASDIKDSIVKRIKPSPVSRPVGGKLKVPGISLSRLKCVALVFIKVFLSYFR